tara:strand:- start:2436 stop:2672 length:237 start_codon:yes stop_codon:yes gene_type:complete
MTNEKLKVAFFTGFFTLIFGAFMTLAAIGENSVNEVLNSGSFTSKTQMLFGVTIIITGLTLSVLSVQKRIKNNDAKKT